VVVHISGPIYVHNTRYIRIYISYIYIYIYISYMQSPVAVDVVRGQTYFTRRYCGDVQGGNQAPLVSRCERR